MQKHVSRLRVLGVDPGSRVVGFAVLEAKKDIPVSPRDWMVLDAGVLRASPDLSIPERLALLHEAMFDLLAGLQPTHAAVERTFHGVNPASVIKLGEARGALIAAIGRGGIPVSEFTPTQIKRAIGGSGAATKEQLAAALRSLLGFSRGQLPLDASDAVAIALTGCLHLPRPSMNLAKHLPRRRSVDSFPKSK